MSNPTQRASWKALEQHHQEIAGSHMRDLFAADPQRFETFSRNCGDVLFDFSKNRINETTFSLLMDLLRESQLEEMTSAMFGGQPINTTEGRSVLHIALRNVSNLSLIHI